MGSNASARMARSRALMTETDRAQIAGETEDEHKRYQAASRVRDRFDALETDIATLEKHHPRLLTELRKIVCVDEDEQEESD